MGREIKFRAFQDDEMLRQPISGVYGSGAFLDLLYEDCDLMRYTGLKDCKGVDVYEGDVIECKMAFEGGSLPHIGEIVYDDTYGAFATRNISGNTLLHNHILSTIRVIGNIYENPELLSDDLQTSAP